jgi:hypothetical protein
MNIVEVEGVYVWIDYEVGDAYEPGEQERIFRDLLEPLGLTYSGSGVSLGTGWRDIDFDVPVGADLHAIRDALDADLGFEFSAEPGYDPDDPNDAAQKLDL